MRACFLLLCVSCSDTAALQSGSPTRVSAPAPSGKTPDAAAPDEPGVVPVGQPPEPDAPDTGPVFQDGTAAAPYLINTSRLPHALTDSRSTAARAISTIDTYPPFTQDESGPEVFYALEIKEPTYVSAALVTPEPSATDIDIHLLSSINPPVTLARHNARLTAKLQPGRYYLVADTFDGRKGAYTLNVMLSAVAFDPATYFNAYVLKAVEALDRDYRLLGYDSAVLTHDITYGDIGTIHRQGDGHTMCVAAVMEVILTAMQIYARETGDRQVWDHLPKSSWETLSGKNIRAHIWVNEKLTSSGTADAIRNFGMGQNIPFEDLRPGAFIGINRTTGTGHAVVFLAFLDAQGNEYSEYRSDVVGFKYYSAQGGYSTGGLDYRWGLFEDTGLIPMPGKRDAHIIRSKDPTFFNTGMMFHPKLWKHTSYAPASSAEMPLGSDMPTVFDDSRFDGVTGAE